MKLHLGCGDKRIDGYINIDCRDLPTVDHVEDIRFLQSFKENSIDVIYVCHVLEHFSRWEHLQVLKRWYDILKIGGILRIAIPDFEKAVKYYFEHGNLRDISGMLYGRQDYPENNHFWCWDFNELTKDLRSVGFINIERYDWRKTEHAHIDDYSQSYLPHMDKDNGTLMSLNVKGIKNA
tara:strand:+ start:204 stop:740 length:537 start_codon:yes stop_codon:yes gene_type:complete